MKKLIPWFTACVMAAQTGAASSEEISVPYSPELLRNTLQTACVLSKGEEGPLSAYCEASKAVDRVFDAKWQECDDVFDNQWISEEDRFDTVWKEIEEKVVVAFDAADSDWTLELKSIEQGVSDRSALFQERDENRSDMLTQRDKCRSTAFEDKYEGLDTAISTHLGTPKAFKLEF